MMIRTNTTNLANAMDVLAREIYCEDGVATCAIAEAAERLRELERENARVRAVIELTLKENSHLADGEICTLARLKTALAAPPKIPC